MELREQRWRLENVTQRRDRSGTWCELSALISRRPRSCGMKWPTTNATNGNESITGNESALFQADVRTI
jgi:hypothetical protein